MELSKKMHSQLSVLALAALLTACGGGGGGGGDAPPSLTGALDALPSAQSVLSGTGFTMNFAGSSDLTFSATLADGTALPAGLTFDPVTRTFTGTSALDLSNDLTVKVTASNGVATAFGTFTLAAVPQGVFRYRPNTTPGSTPLFYGVVFPKSTGVAEMWSWEYLDTGVRLWSADVAYPGSTFASTAAQRRSIGASFSSVDSVHAAAVKITNGMRFTVGSNSYDAARLADAWPAASAVPATLSDWAGRWEATGEMSDLSVSVTHDWTVNAEGRISGQKLNGDVQACVVEDGSRIELTGTPVSRVFVTYTCTDGTSGDYSGISFTRQSGSLSGKVVLLKKLDAVNPVFNSLSFTPAITLIPS